MAELVEFDDGVFSGKPNALRSVELSDVTPIADETLLEQSARVWSRILPGSVIIDNQPLEAVGSVPMSPDELKAFSEKIEALIPDSIARLQARIAIREAEDAVQTKAA